MHFFRHNLHLTITILFLSLAHHGTSQVRDNSRRVDTLSFAERFSVRTNVVDWVLTVPNIGFEYDLGRTNYNRHAVNLNLRFRPGSSGSLNQPLVFNLFEVTGEWRMYWSERRAEPNGYMKRHQGLLDKLFSCRTASPSHPKWIFYRGAYLSYADYDVYLRKWDGIKGQAVMGGFTWGFVKPFLAFQNGNSLDMEFGISAGVAVAKYDRYKERQANNGQAPYDWRFYDTGRSKDWHIVPFPVLRDLHVAVVYRFGHYPLMKKYRWRYDVDMAYREQVNNAWTTRYTEREAKFVRDSLYRVVSRDFRELYDSVVAVRHAEKQESIDRRAPQRVESDADTLSAKQKLKALKRRKQLRDITKAKKSK